MQGVFHDHVDSDSNLKHVADVLDMWSFMEEAYEGLTAAQRKRLVEEIGPWAKTVSLLGFDGNNESSQMSIASFLVNQMDRFTRFKGRDLNSHSPTYGRYSCMLTLFEPMRRTFVGHGLDAAQPCHAAQGLTDNATTRTRHSPPLDTAEGRPTA